MKPLPNPVSPGRAVALLSIFLAFQFGAAIGITGIGLILDAINSDWGFSLRDSGMWFGVVNIIAALCVIDIERRWRGTPWTKIEIPREPFKQVVFPALLAGTGLVWVALSLLGHALPWLYEWGMKDNPLEELLNPMLYPFSAIFLACIVAPFTEEFICRYMVLGGLLRTVAPRKALLLSALLFSALHLNIWQAPATFAMGLLIGWTYYRTRSLALCILMHAVHNGFVISTPVIAMKLDPTLTMDSDQVPTWLLSFPLLVSAAVVLALGVYLLKRSTRVPVDMIVTPPPAKPRNSPPPLPANPVPAQDSAFQDSSNQRSTGMTDELASLVTTIAERARAASHVLATVPTAQKNAALAKLAEIIPAAAETLKIANQKDLDDAAANGLTPAQIDRLTLTPARLEQLAESVRQVATLPDPVGAALETTTRPNGLVIEKRRVPIGVIGIIYEARPNVTIDCAILCLKSGNAAILRGGKEIFHTNTALAALIAEALAAADLPSDAVQLIPTTDRAALNTMLKLDELVHCIIPRGGEGLIRFVATNSTIPVIKHYTGVCFVHLDKSADPDLAEAITVNAKTQRPGVCNAAEQLLVDAASAEQLLPRVGRVLVEAGVELRVDERSAAILAAADIAHVPANASDFTDEFLGMVMAVRIVDSLEEAIATINRDSSGHSETIVTTDAEAAARFQAAVDSSAVFWNASTRFNDGFEFGFGAEIGISTDRLHARGPMGLPELCSYKFVVNGTGQVRS